MTADDVVERKDVAGRRPPLQPPRFDRVAPFYGLLERLAFCNALQHARTAFLDFVTDSSRALIVGEGDGRFLAELRRKNSNAAVDCVDASAAMLRLARERTRDETVQFHRHNIMDWQSNRASYNLIVTHFFLDCFDQSQLGVVIDKIDSLAAPNARWLISDFNLPPGGFARLHARIWLRVMYSFFRVAAHLQTRELVPFAPLLRDRDFHLAARRDSPFGLITAQLWQR
jgi:ubiquinone/menaquinone biosynthesis C-methylase UbiE